MADTTSPLLGLLLMEVGGDNNAWGTNLNTQVITLIENAIAGVVTVPVTGGSYSLSAAEARSAVIVLSGVLTADQTIVVPNTAKTWRIYNGCTGAFYVLVKTASGTAVNAPAGKETSVICYGGDVVRRSDRHLVGELFYHAGTTAPAGSIECDGATPLRASTVDLFAEISTTWGAGNGATTYTLPDGKTAGKFLRARTASVTVGTAQTNQNKSHTHTGSGTTSGASAFHTHTGSGTTSAMSANSSHTHSNDGTGNGGTTGYAGASPGNHGPVTINIAVTNTDHTHTYSFTTSTDSVDHTHTYSFTTSTGSADGTEARPECLVGMLCIRY